MIKVAIIDNGIDTRFIAKKKVVKKILWQEELRVNDITDYHGTVCAKIIERICADIKLYDLVIMQKTASINDLISSLWWCYRNSIKVINLSIGTLNYYDGMKVKSVVSKLVQKGCFIVAAYHNYNIKSFPAVFPDVFGVCHTQSNELIDGEYFIQPGEKKLFVACMRDVSLGNGIYMRYFNANSFATPVIAGKIALYLNEFPEAKLLQVMRFLEINQKESCYEKIIIKNQFQNLKYKKEFSKIIVLDRKAKFRLNKFLKKANSEGKLVITLDYNCISDKRIPYHWYCLEKKISIGLIYTLNEIYQADFFLFYGDASECNLNLFNHVVDVVILHEQNEPRIYIGTQRYVNLDEHTMINLIMNI